MRLFALIVFLFIGLASRPTVAAQADRLEVASIRPQKENFDRAYYQFPSPGTITITYAPLRQIVARAYEIDFMLQRFKLVSGSREVDRILDARFDIQAKVPENTSPEQRRAMMRALLEERFGLRIRSENRSTPVYALRLLRDEVLGPDLRRTTHDCIAFRKAVKENTVLAEPRDVYGDPICTRDQEYHTPKRDAYKMRDAAPFNILVQRIQGFADRPIVNQTGLSGNFDWVISFSNDPLETEVPSLRRNREARPQPGAPHCSR